MDEEELRAIKKKERIFDLFLEPRGTTNNIGFTKGQKNEEGIEGTSEGEREKKTEGLIWK